jgi:hypothetical protein
MSDISPDSSSPVGNMAVPLIVTLVAFVGFLGFQTNQILSARSAIATENENQTGPLAESQKVRDQLQRIAGNTAELANKGNANAKQIVAEFAKQGITLSPPKTGATPGGKADTPK